jgi:ferredoxin
MSLLRSIAYGLKEARFNPVTVVHSLIYAPTVTYLKMLARLVRIGPPALRTHITDTYHGKVVRMAEARKIITVNRNIELRNLEQVIPYRRAKDLVLVNPHNIVVYECPCRGIKQDPCRPTEVCLIVGEPFSDLVRMVQPFRSRRISPQHALQILQEEHERGHVHTAWFKTSMIDRFYAICNCCKCCCLGMKFMTDYGMRMLLPSGYRAIVGEACIGCGVCLPYCQFDALALMDREASGTQRKQCAVIPEKCFGCGVCENRCRKGCISLVRDPEKGVPLDIEALAGER